MEEEVILRVVIGATRLTHTHHQPTLVVEAEADRLDGLRLQMAPRFDESELTWIQTVLAASSQSEVTWYCFNDARMNGVVSLEHWQSIYPNLQVTGEEQLSARTLADLLNDWPLAHQSQHAIELTIAQGNPVQILEGAGPWIHRIQRIQLQGPRAAELWGESCDPWLQQQGFRPDPENHVSWTLDPLAARLIQQQADVESLRREHEQQMAAISDQCNNLLAALRHVFPYAAYRQKRPDITAFNDQQLVDHFVTYGIHEGINLPFSAVESELQQLREEQAAESARIALLNDKNRHTTQQLELLKDLLARLMVTP